MKSACKGAASNFPNRVLPIARVEQGAAWTSRAEIGFARKEERRDRDARASGDVMKSLIGSVRISSHGIFKTKLIPKPGTVNLELKELSVSGNGAVAFYKYVYKWITKRRFSLGLVRVRPSTTSLVWLKRWWANHKVRAKPDVEVRWKPRTSTAPSIHRCFGRVPLSPPEP
jgi:hypothetical protein